MEGPKTPSEARWREAPERRGGEVWGKFLKFNSQICAF